MHFFYSCELDRTVIKVHQQVLIFSVLASKLFNVICSKSWYHLSFPELGSCTWLPAIPGYMPGFSTENNTPTEEVWLIEKAEQNGHAHSSLNTLLYFLAYNIHLLPTHQDCSACIKRGSWFSDQDRNTLLWFLLQKTATATATLLFMLKYAATIEPAL